MKIEDFIFQDNFASEWDEELLSLFANREELCPSVVADFLLVKKLTSIWQHKIKKAQLQYIDFSWPDATLPDDLYIRHRSMCENDTPDRITTYPTFKKYSEYRLIFYAENTVSASRSLRYFLKKNNANGIRVWTDADENKVGIYKEINTHEIR